jgi:hypothetical protein
MMKINVALPSGRTKTLSLPESSEVGDLQVLAQKSFLQGFLRLVTANGQMLLDPMQSLQAAGIHEGDNLTALALHTRIAATRRAFALWRSGGVSIITWGNRSHAGDSSAVRDQLRGVQQVHASKKAFAAILAEGSVVTWGHAAFGGDSSAVQDQLKGVQQVHASEGAFAAILADGSVVTWGDAEYGGYSPAVRDDLMVL